MLVAEALRGGGYKTAAFVQSWVSKPFGFDQGWDLFRHEQESLAVKMPKVLDWIEKNRSGRFFVFLYSTDTHYPFLHAHERRNLYGDFPSAFEFNLDTIEGVRAGTLHPSADDIANAMAMYDEGIHWTDADLAPLFAYLQRAGLSENDDRRLQLRPRRGVRRARRDQPRPDVLRRRRAHAARHRRAGHAARRARRSRSSRRTSTSRPRCSTWWASTGRAAGAGAA